MKEQRGGFLISGFWLRTWGFTLRLCGSWRLCAETVFGFRRSERQGSRKVAKIRKDAKLGKTTNQKPSPDFVRFWEADSHQWRAGGRTPPFAPVLSHAICRFITFAIEWHETWLWCSFESPWFLLAATLFRVSSNYCRPKFPAS